MDAKQIYILDVTMLFPAAPAALEKMGVDLEYLNDTDLSFYVFNGKLYSSSDDERSAFVYEARSNTWEETAYPLNFR